MQSTNHNVDTKTLGAGLDTLRSCFQNAGGQETNFLLEQLQKKGAAGKELAAAISNFAAQADNVDECLAEIRSIAGAREVAGRLALAFAPYLENLKNLDGGPNFKVFTSQTGAAAAIPDILKYIGGASKYLINSTLPYHEGESHKFVNGIGFEKGAVNQHAALSLANAAYYEMMETLISRPRPGLNGGQGPDLKPHMIALGLSASTATGRNRRGKDHVWIAVRTLKETYTAYVQLGKGQGQNDRDRQDAMCNVLGINAILAAAQLPQMPILDYQLESDALVDNPDGPGRILNLQQLKIDPQVFEGPGPFLFKPDGELASEQETQAFLEQNIILYPGSFETVHFGHQSAAAEAFRQENGSNQGEDCVPVVFEICADNFDPKKGSISNEELARRVVQNFGRNHTVITRGCPLITQKLELFKGAKRVVTGYDVAEKFVAEESYPGGASERDQVLKTFQRRDGIVYVLGRHQEGLFKSALDLTPPIRFKDLFFPLTGEAQVSSTLLRELK